ncbi:MAG: beta-lactamase family protein [Crocinitomicaceae bacterium]|nr:beta-lactamase family protein [Crocinitomicaceae bacterium]
MNKIKHIWILLFFYVSQPSFAQDMNFSELKEKYDFKLKEKNEGIAVLVKNKQNIGSVGIGNFQLNDNTVFNIGSATKTFTVVLLLQEVEKGNLKLSDRIGQYLDPIRNVDENLTIESLITHESGLDEVIGSNLTEIFDAQSDSLYELSMLHSVEKNKSELIGEFDYCNTNYFLLGKILEKVTDRFYFDLLRERIFEPIGMKNSYPYLYKNIPNLAPPYHEGMDVSNNLDHRFYANIAFSAGSIASTLSDMEKFYTGLFETTVLLEKESVERMMVEGNSIYGLGLFKWEVDSVSLFGHGGNNIGYSFRNAYDPASKSMYLVFANSRGIPFQKDLTDDLLALMQGEEVKLNNSFDLDKFKHLVGSYELKQNGMLFEFSIEDNRLYLTVPSQGIKCEMNQKNSTTIVDTQVGANFELIEGNNEAIKFSQNGFETQLNRVSQ